jgi:hypothetical protein
VSKSDRIAHLRHDGFNGLDPHYGGWFACFNRGDFYEAHDVLEDLWLRERGGGNDRFYKGLIQLAGAFVHLQKGRLRPGDALFRLAESNLTGYAPRHARLNVEVVLEVIRTWRGALAVDQFKSNPLETMASPVFYPEEAQSTEP